MQLDPFPPQDFSHLNQQQQGYPVGQQFYQQPSRYVKKTNVLGIIALILAVIGFIFSCIPGALIIGWVLIPAAFILGIVSLFVQGKSKWMGISAIIISVIGTIIGFLVFMSVLGDSLGGDEVSYVESEKKGFLNDSADSPGESEQGSRENPYPVNSTLETEQWRLVINSVDLQATDKILAENMLNEQPDPGSQYIMVNYSVTYLGDDPDGKMPEPKVDYVTSSGTTIHYFDNFVVVPDRIDEINTLYNGGTETGNIAFEVPSDTASEGVLAIHMETLDNDKAFVAVN